uniref:Uncharacterized protein n=1 Tax=Denticeps clupeoides TaxID=299321 RepID=A0AAY4B5X2_9TELE
RLYTSISSTTPSRIPCPCPAPVKRIDVCSSVRFRLMTSPSSRMILPAEWRSLPVISSRFKQPVSLTSCRRAGIIGRVPPAGGNAARGHNSAVGIWGAAWRHGRRRSG